jgi:hypothetical protein
MKSKILLVGFFLVSLGLVVPFRAVAQWGPFFGWAGGPGIMGGWGGGWFGRSCHAARAHSGKTKWFQMGCIGQTKHVEKGGWS